MFKFWKSNELIDHSEKLHLLKILIGVFMLDGKYRHFPCIITQSNRDHVHTMFIQIVNYFQILNPDNCKISSEYIG